MTNKTMTLAAAVIAAAAMGGLTAQPAAAQYGGPPNQYQDRNSQDQYQDRGPDRYRGPPSSGQFDEGYRTGYRAGYEASRTRKRYDDRPIATNDLHGDPNIRWRQRYTQVYTFNDDSYYRDCRTSPDPAGVIAGALIGGLIGNSVGRGGGRGGATVAGVVVGGALGATMTRNLDCGDRSYAYQTYSDGFNGDRPNSTYRWYNGQNDHNGELRVGTYYEDPDGFRCANFSQVVYIQGRAQESRGRACRQPDGTWAIVG